MSARCATPGGRLALLALLAVALTITLVLHRRRTQWVLQGRLVKTIATTVAGAPPWQTSLDLAEPGGPYLVEMTVTVQAASRAVVPRLAPRIRLLAPDGQPADLQLEASPLARTTSRGARSQVACHWWLRPTWPGAYTWQVLSLQAEPADLRPLAWRIRLATDAPQQPGGALGVTLGFACCAGLLLLLALSPRRAAPS